MSWLFRGILKYIASLKKKVNVKHHVTFTKSTLRKERERKMRNIASPMPFKNFVNELSLIVMDKRGKDRMTLKESALMRKTAVRMWRHLDENLKNRYRRMAIKARDARVPKSCLREVKSSYQMNIRIEQSVQKLEVVEMDELRYMPKRCRSTTNIKSIYDKPKRHTAGAVKNCIDKETPDTIVSEASSSIRISRKRQYPDESDRKKENIQATPSSNQLKQGRDCYEISLSPPDEKNPRLNSYPDQEDPN